MKSNLVSSQEVEPLVACIETTRRLLDGISRQSVYNLLNNEDLESVRIAGRRLVTVESIKALIARSKISGKAA